MSVIHVNGGKAIIEGVSIQGFDVGIKTTNTDLSTRDVHFKDVRQPYDVTGGTANVIGTRIRETKSYRQSTTSKDRVGWTPDGPALPSKCDECGAIFPSRRYGVRSSLFYGRDNTDVCPICGNQEAKVSDGLFDLTTEAIGIVEAISNDPTMLASLYETSSSVLSGKTPAAAGFETMQAISPKIKDLAEKVSSHGFNASWFMAIFVSVAIGWYFSSTQADSSTQPTAKYVHEQCLRIINEVQKLEIEERKNRTLQHNSGIEAKGKSESEFTPLDDQSIGVPKPKPKSD